MPDGERARRRVESRLEAAGIATGGERPWDIRVRDARFFNRVAEDGVRGLVDSHMQGWWDCDDPGGMVGRAFEGRVFPWLPSLAGLALERLLVLRAPGVRCPVGPRHRDLGRDFFGTGGDPSLQYSCAAFDGAGGPAEMLRLKAGSIAAQLGPDPGVRIVDADRALRADAGGRPDRVVDIDPARAGLRERMERVRGAMRCGGLFLCQAVTVDRPAEGRGLPRGGHPLEDADLPTATDILQAAEDRFECVGMWNLGDFGIPQVDAWEGSFMAMRGGLERRHGEAFARMWRLWLTGIEGIVRARRMRVMRFLFAPGGRRRGARGGAGFSLNRGCFRK